MESYTVGSSEFTINYAARNGIISLMDNGHLHLLLTHHQFRELPGILKLFQLLIGRKQRVEKSLLHIARARFKQSLDEILAVPYDKEKVLVCLESKVFGIGMDPRALRSQRWRSRHGDSPYACRESGLKPSQCPPS